MSGAGEEDLSARLQEPGDQPSRARVRCSCRGKQLCLAIGGSVAVLGAFLAIFLSLSSSKTPLPDCPPPETGRLSIELQPAEPGEDGTDQRCSDKQPSLFSKILLDVTRLCNSSHPADDQDCSIVYHTAYMYLDAGHEIDVTLNFSDQQPGTGRWDFFQVAAILHQNGCNAELQLSKYETADCLEGNASHPNFEVSVDPLGRIPAHARTQLTCISRQRAADAPNGRTIRKWRTSVPLSDQSVVTMWFTCNFVGIACLRTMHFQYLVWYFHTIPFLAYASFGSGRLHQAAAVTLITLLVEIPFLLTEHGEVRGPDGRRWTTAGLPTRLGSVLLQATHWLLLLRLLWSSRPKGKTD
ncbi:l(2)not [Symbiodinium sp. CCMP2592]|nr:l(2)not [Symbiodinium sp. CCMP2592]